MSESKIARYYVADANPMGGSFPGVPLRDLSESEWNEIAPWIQASVDASPMYRKTPVPKPAAEKAEKD